VRICRSPRRVLGTCVVRHEERTGEAAVLVGEAHHHVVAARPDVQALRVHLRRAVGVRGEGDLLVIVLDVLLAVVETAVASSLARTALNAPSQAEDDIGFHGLGFLPFPVEGAGRFVEVHIVHNWYPKCSVTRSASSPLRKAARLFNSPRLTEWIALFSMLYGSGSFCHRGRASCGHARAPRSPPPLRFPLRARRSNRDGSPPG
jgi:hypothetical protein